MFNSEKVIENIIGKEKKRKKLRQDKPNKLWGEGDEELVFTPQKSIKETLTIKILPEKAGTCPWCGSVKTRTKVFVHDKIGIVCDNCNKSYTYDKVTGEIDKNDWRAYKYF